MGQDFVLIMLEVCGKEFFAFKDKIVTNIPQTLHFQGQKSGKLAITKGKLHEISINYALNC